MACRPSIAEVTRAFGGLFAKGRRFGALCLVVLCLAVLMPFETAFADDVGGQTTQGTIRILFVGNSLTHYSSTGVAEKLVELARANGKDVDAQRVTFGGASLDQYAQSVTGVKKRYTTFEALLTRKRWDYVVLQEKSKYPVTNPVEMYCSIRRLKRHIAAVQPQAEVLLYMTHGFDNGTKTPVNGKERRLSASELSAYVQSYYSCVGKKLGLRVVPVGEYFERYRSTSGAITNKLIVDDGRHPSAAGFFFAASAFYEAIFGEAPKNPITNLPGLSQDEQYELFTMMGTTFASASSYKALAVGQSAQVSPISVVPAEGDEPVVPEEPGEENPNVPGEPGEGDSPDTPGESGEGGSPDNLDVQESSEEPGNPADSNVPANGGDPDGGDSGDGGDPDGGGDSQEEPLQVRYSSLDPSIVTVNEAGKITAHQPGKTAIVLQSAEGERATCYVSVEAGALLSSKIVFPKKSVKITAGEEETLIPAVSEFLGAYALEWTTKNKRVASVSALGTVTGKGAGKTKVIAKDAVSGRSASYTITVRLKAPQKVKVSRTEVELYGKAKSALKVSWQSVKGAKSYKMYRSVGANGPAKYVGKTKKCSFVDGKVVLNKVVTYTVVATNGKSAQKSFASDGAQGIAIGKTKLTAAMSGDKLKLSWAKRNAVDGYQLYRAPAKKGSFKRIAKLSSDARTSWVDEDVRAGKQYRYKVRSFRKVGGKTFYSAYSDVVTVKVKKSKKTSSSRLETAALR